MKLRTEPSSPVLRRESAALAARGSTAEKFYAHRGWMPADQNAETRADIIFRKTISARQGGI
jgi:hypothetical protein